MTENELNKAKIMILLRQYNMESNDLSVRELLATIFIAEILEKYPEIETEILNSELGTENYKETVKYIFNFAHKERKSIERALVIANKAAEEYMVDERVKKYENAIKNEENQ